MWSSPPPEELPPPPPPPPPLLSSLPHATTPVPAAATTQPTVMNLWNRKVVPLPRVVPRSARDPTPQIRLCEGRDTPRRPSVDQVPTDRRGTGRQVEGRASRTYASRPSRTRQTP